MQELMLSVAVITYNQEEYIAQTLDSILSQKHNYPYEIVVGEDCSQDGTKKIIEEYVEKYPNIIKPLYNNPNKGLIKNYFNVIAHCQGKYIMECAGDDYWLPGKVKTQIKYMENNPDVGMCYGVVQYIDGRGEKKKSEFAGEKKESFEALLRGNGIPAVTICMRNNLVTEYIKDVNPLEKGWLMEDYPMWLWFSQNSRLVFQNKKMAAYRSLDGSASHSQDPQKRAAFVKSIEDIQLFFAQKYYEGERLIQYYAMKQALDEERRIIGLFSKANIERNRDNIIKYGKLIPDSEKTCKIRLKLLLVRSPLLFKVLFERKWCEFLVYSSRKNL